MKVGDTYGNALGMSRVVGGKEEHEESLDGAILSGEIKGAIDRMLMYECCKGEIGMMWSGESSVDEV